MGYDPKDYGLHSLRSGGVTPVVSNDLSQNVSERLLKLHGRRKRDEAKDMYVFEPQCNRLRAQLYGLGYPRQPSPRATLAEVTFSLFLSKIQPAVYIRIASSSRGARQLGWASCLTSAGRVTLASGTTFLHINALARLTGTSLGVANVT